MANMLFIWLRRTKCIMLTSIACQKC